MTGYCRPLVGEALQLDFELSVAVRFMQPVWAAACMGHITTFRDAPVAGSGTSQTLGMDGVGHET